MEKKTSEDKILSVTDFAAMPFEDFMKMVKAQNSGEIITLRNFFVNSYFAFVPLRDKLVAILQHDTGIRQFKRQINRDLGREPNEPLTDEECIKYYDEVMATLFVLEQRSDIVTQECIYRGLIAPIDPESPEGKKLEEIQMRLKGNVPEIKLERGN